MSNVFDFAGSGPQSDEPLETPQKSRSKRRDPDKQLSSSQLRSGQLKMLDMVEMAFNALHEAMEFADYATSVKAAQILLDRTGFGPKTTVDVNTTHMDLSNLTEDQLAERATKIAALLSVPKTINVTPTIQ